MTVVDDYDVVVVGSGAGGGTMALALAGTGARVLLLERGDFVPQEDANWSPAEVWRGRRYRTDELWLDDRGREFHPYTHYCVGGNSKFWGCVLCRLRREDFEAVEHVDGTSPAWPITYEDLAPYYERAELLYGVHGQDGVDPTEPPRRPFPFEAVPHSPTMAGVVTGLRAQGLHPSALPLGLQRGCRLCDTCNSFPCRVLAKSEADVCCVRPAAALPNVTLWTRAYVRRLTTSDGGRRVEATEVERDGQVVRVRALLFVVSCGAVNSAALLLRSVDECHPAGLANSSGLLGRQYMAHLATFVTGVHPLRRNPTVFQKTVAINDFYFRGRRQTYPLGHIQSQGRTHSVVAQLKYPRVPLWLYEYGVSRGVDWLAMTEDLPQRENRVELEPSGRIRLRYRPSNVAAHRALVRELRRILRRLGLPLVVSYSNGVVNTTHQCGTACFGHDPAASVLDPYCRAHDLDNLFVVDASFFPSSAAVNPALTVIAQSLRVAEHIAVTDLQQTGQRA